MTSHVQIRIRSIVIGMLMAGVVAGAAVLAVPPQTRQSLARQNSSCLAIGEGVCFSGTTEWVAQAAAKVAVQSRVMLAMSGDAF